MAEGDRESIQAFLDGILAQDAEDHARLASLRVLSPTQTSWVPKPDPGWHAVSYAATFNGRLAIMWADVDLDSHRRRLVEAAEVGVDLPPPTANVRLVLFDGTSLTKHCSFVMATHRPVFDYLSDGTWVVADTWAETAAPNAMHLNADGSIRAQLRLGIDIQHLQADPDGGMWIGYGDKGTCGDGHGFEQGGIVRFEEALAPSWSLNVDAGRGAAHCDYAYALNIAASGRWAYTYTDFNLTHLDAVDGPRSMRARAKFCDAIAVAGARVMAVGMSRPRLPPGGGLERVVGLSLPRRARGRHLKPRWIAAIERDPPETERLCVARGDTLHMVAGKTWTQLSIADAEMQLGLHRRVR